MNIVAVTQSALAAGLLRFQAASGNLANISTPGYQPVRVDLKTAANGGVSTSLSTPTPPPVDTYDAFGRTPEAPSGVDPAQEIVDLLDSKRQVGLSAAVLRRAYESQGSLLDILA